MLTYISFVVASGYIYFALSKIQSIRKNDLILFILTAAIVQQIGGEIIPHIHLFITRGEIPRFWQPSRYPGRFFHSVFLSLLIYVIFICHQLKWPKMKVLDHFITAAILMSAIGRIGCYMQGCCLGKPTDLPWGVAFPKTPDIIRHPVQLYMFAAETSLFLIMVFVQKIKKYDGQVFWVGLFLYSIYRFSIEFVRTNPIFILGLSHAQSFSVISGVVSLYFLIRQRNK